MLHGKAHLVVNVGCLQHLLAIDDGQLQTWAWSQLTRLAAEHDVPNLSQLVSQLTSKCMALGADAGKDSGSLYQIWLVFVKIMCKRNLLDSATAGVLLRLCLVPTASDENRTRCDIGLVSMINYLKRSERIDTLALDSQIGLFGKIVLSDDLMVDRSMQALLCDWYVLNPNAFFASAPTAAHDLFVCKASPVLGSCDWLSIVRVSGCLAASVHSSTQFQIIRMLLDAVRGCLLIPSICARSFAPTLSARFCGVLRCDIWLLP